MANKALKAARKAYSKNKDTKYKWKNGKKTKKTKKDKGSKTVASSYEKVREKTQNTQQNRDSSRAQTKNTAVGVGSAVKSNFLNKKKTDSKPTTSGSGYNGRSRSGAIAPTKSSVGETKRAATSTARSQAKATGKAIKTAVNPHRGDTIESIRNMKRKEGESQSDFLKRKYEASKKYNANGVVRQETKTKTGYTDDDRAELSSKTESELKEYYGKKYNRVKAFRDMWNEEGGLGDQFKEVNGREATAEERKDYYKKYWKPDYEEQTAKIAKEQADEYAKEQLPDTLYSKELSKNESAAIREYSKYVGKKGLGNKAIKGLGTLKYTLDDLGTKKPDGTKVTKEDLGKVKTDKKGKPVYQQVEMRDYKGNVVKDKNGNPVMTDRNVAEELGSITATGTNKGKFAAGFMEGSSPVDIFSSGVGEYNNAAKKVIQNTKESGAYMGGYMGGFMAQFMASGVPFVERGLMEQAIERGVVEDADNVVGKLLNKAIGGAEKNAGIKFAENRGLELALEAPINFADAAKMSMDENGNVNTKALAFYMTLNTGMTAGMGGAMEGVGVAFTRSNAKRFADLYAKSLTGRATADELLEMNKLQMKLNKAGSDVAVAKSNVAHKSLYNKAVADVVFDETASADKALSAMHGATEHTEKMEYAQAIRDKALADIDTLREDRIKLLDEANSASPEKAIELRKQASSLQEQMDYLSNIARGADNQYKVSAKVNRRALNELKVDLQRMSFKTGVNYRVVDDATMRDVMRELGGNPEEGRFYRGYFYKNEKGELEVLVNADSPQAHQIVVGHEMGHMIKDSSPEEFARMSELVRDYAKKLDGYDELEAEIRENYKGLEGVKEEQIQEEISCELIGKFIVGGDKAFIKEVAGDKSLFKKIVDYIKQLFDTTTSKELKSQYGKLHKMLLDAADSIDTSKVKAPEMKKANGEELRMSQFKTVKDITPDTVMRDGKVTKEADDAYAEAVKKKDWKRAQAFVDAVLESKGYDVEVFHGSDTFGFTKFDIEKMSEVDKGNKLYDATMIFLTDNEQIAASYIKESYSPQVRDLKDANRWTTNEHNIVTEDISDATDMWTDSIMSMDVNDLAHGSKLEDSWFLGETKDGFEKYYLTLELTKDKCEVKIQDYETFDPVDSFSFTRGAGEDVYDWRYSAAYEVEQGLVDIWKSGKLGHVPTEPNKGIYRGKAKLENPYVIDVNGGRWNKIPFPYDDLTEAEKSWIKLLEKADGYTRDMDGDNILLKTRDIGQLAANRGHDGVQFKNVYDVGGSWKNPPKDALSDVTIVYNSEQVKVADVATYDDKGKLIPLSERGNETNPDLRFSQAQKKNIDIKDLSLYKDAKSYDDFVETNFDTLKANIDSFGRTANGGDEMEEVWRMKRSDSLKSTAKELSQEDAVDIIRSNIKNSHLSGWFRNGDSGYKPRIAEQILNNDDTLNAGWNLMYRHYKDVTGENLSFKEFLDTPITLYRGNRGVDKVSDDVFTAFSFDEKIAQNHARGDVNSLSVKPKDTWGSYQTTVEAEVLVPEYVLGKEGNLRFSQELRDGKANPENINLRATEGEVQGRQVLTEPNRKVGEEEGRGLEEGGRDAEGVRVVSNDIRKKMDKAGIGNSGLREANHEEFSKALDEARKANPRGDYVDGKSIEELKEHGAKCYLTDDGRAGVCVEKDGNISGLFRHPDSTHKGVLRELVLTARENGGTKMDCFGEYLADAYEQCGFRIVNKIENNPKFSDIKDDVYTLMRTPESTDEVLYRIAIGNFDESYENVPFYSIKEFGDDAYDEALKARDEKLDWQNKYKMSDDEIKALDEDYMYAVDAGDKEEAKEYIERVASSKLKDSVARNEDGTMIHVFQGTMKGGYDRIDMSKASPMGDSGAGSYSTNNWRDASGNYASEEGGDNNLRIERRAQELLDDPFERDITDWDEALERAKEELVGDSQVYEFVVDTRRPVYVGGENETNLMDSFFEDIGRREDYETSWERSDFDNEDDFLEAVDNDWYQECSEKIDQIAYKVEDIADNWDDAREAIREILSKRLIDEEPLSFKDLKDELHEYPLFDENWNSVQNEIARAITEELGHDSIWDRTVYAKWGRGMDTMSPDDFHIIVFRPEQYKLIDTVTRDLDGNVIPPSKRFDTSNEGFRFSQSKKKSVPKLKDLESELKNYETALKKASTKEEKSLLEGAIKDVKDRISKFKKSGAPKEPPKKAPKTSAKKRVQEMKESAKIREEFNKYRDKNKKWAKYKELADLEKERWDLIEEMGYKRGNKKQEARLEEIMQRENELRDFDETKYGSFGEEKEAVYEELWNSFKNKRERAATKADIAELEGAKQGIKDLQPKVDALTKDIEALEAKLKKARSEATIEKLKKQIRGKKSARTKLENKMKANADTMVKSADRMANRAEVAGKKLAKKKAKPVAAEPVPKEPLKATKPISALKNPKISKSEKVLKQKALRSKHAEDVNLTVLREREYIKEQYGNESGFFKVLEDAINNGFYNKKKGLSVKEAKEKARAELADMGYEQMRNLYLRTNPASDPFLAVERLQTLREEISRLADSGEGAADIHADEALLWQPMAEMSNFGGRALRAIREIRMLTPEGRRQVIYSEIDRLQKRYAKRIKGGEIEVDPKKIERLAELEDGEERDALLQEINIDIWSQIPASFWEKMNEVRHCFMLFNARTHARNMFGNLVFAAVRKTSDELEYAILNSAGVKSKIEAMGGKVDKMHVSRAEKQEFGEYVKAEFDAVYKDSGSRNKYMEMGRPDGVPTINWKPMQDVINNNYWLLEQEDLKLTLIPAFENAYLGWCKSRCPEKTALKDFMNNMSASMKNKARHYALAQGEYATFRDACALSSWITGKKEMLAGMKGETWFGTAGYRALDTVLEGALPFVKTPVNIFRRSIDYSPVALLRAWSELSKATDVEVFKKGIHDLCTGLTGTAIMGIGFAMATQGWFTLKTGSDKEGSGDAYIDRDMGFQDYSLKVTPPNWFGFNPDHDTWSWSLDWASPTAMSLFSGAALYEQMREGIDKYKDEGLSAFFNSQQAMNTFFAITSPMTDTSFMSSSKDTMQKFLERMTRGTDDGKEIDFGGAMAQLITGDLPKNYLTGFEPQLMAQIAGFTDPIQRDTRSTAKSEFVRGWDSAFKQLVSRVPVARTMLNPKLDRYGADKINEDSTFARFLEAMIMPSNVKKINMNERDQKLIQIREGIEDKSSDQYKYFWYPMSGNPSLDLADGKRMTYDELYKYGKRSRRFQARRFDEMFESPSYDYMTPKMRADEVDEYDFMSQHYADWKVYGANYAVEALKKREDYEVNSINAYRRQKGTGKDDEAANETYMKYYIRKEKYLTRSHADTQDGYSLKALSAIMSGDEDLEKAVASAGDIGEAKFDAMRKYMKISLKDAGGDKKKRRDNMFKELTDNTCNIMSNLDAVELAKNPTKGLKSASAGLCAAMGLKASENYYRAMGHNWNSAQAGGGLLNKYNKNGKYDLEKIDKYKQDIKSLGDVTGDGKQGKADVMHYIENDLGITDPDEAACAYEVLYSYGRYKNPYKSEIDDHLKWGENKDDWWGTDVGGHGRGGRRGRRRGHGGGGGGGSSKGKMPTTATGAISGKVTDPFATSNGSKASNLNDAYRRKVRKLRKQLN